MEISLFASAALTFVLLWFILSPVLHVDRREVLSVLGDGERTLTDQKERCIQVLRDLDLDFETQKILESDYQFMKSQISHELAGILERLDLLRKDAN